MKHGGPTGRKRGGAGQHHHRRRRAAQQAEGKTKELAIVVEPARAQRDTACLPQKLCPAATWRDDAPPRRKPVHQQQYKSTRVCKASGCLQACCPSGLGKCMVSRRTRASCSQRLRWALMPGAKQTAIVRRTRCAPFRARHTDPPRQREEHRRSCAARNAGDCHSLPALQHRRGCPRAAPEAQPPSSRTWTPAWLLRAVSGGLTMGGTKM